MPRPIKKFKSLDDDKDVTNILEVTTEVDKDDETDDSISEVIMDEEGDDIEVTGSGEDDISVSLSSPRANRPPPKNWADGIKTKFSIGDLVCFKGAPTSIYKVLGPSKFIRSYSLKPSGADTTINDVHEDKIRLADSSAKWKDYWDTVNDPYRDWLRSKAKKETVTPEKVVKPVTKRIKKNNKK